jgi:hypothetical protein
MKKKKIKATNTMGHVLVTDYDEERFNLYREMNCFVEVVIITVEEPDNDDTKPFKVSAIVDGVRVSIPAIKFDGTNKEAIEQFTDCFVIKKETYNMIISRDCKRTMGFHTGEYITKATICGRTILMSWTENDFTSKFKRIK